MYSKVIFVLAAAVVLAAIYAGSEALARGGGGGRGGHGGMTSGMMSGGHGFAWRGMPRMSSHGAHFPFKGQHANFKGQHANGMHKFGHDQRQDHRHMMAQGQWHQVSGFGGQGQKWSSMPGMWHKVASFGSHGQFKTTRDSRRDWQAGGGGGSGGDGWGFVGIVGLCLSPGSCQGQGIWQAVPQNGGQPGQSRSFQRDWQVNGEL